ncbi:LicD family-domain-containing protein [Xylariaceae sp. FL0804]|nr:LicD family-domain-containing protein [Xylariaceae sp. FL0804]
MHLLHPLVLALAVATTSSPAAGAPAPAAAASSSPQSPPRPPPPPSRYHSGGAGGGGGSGRVAYNKAGPAGAAPPAEQKKYFLEPGGGSELGHYDARFFRGRVDYDEHGAALRRLVRAYLTTCASLGVETWLAHGSLLGWWWSGRVMPWDYDLDVQVRTRTLEQLARSGLNGSLHDFIFPDPGSATSSPSSSLGGEDALALVRPVPLPSAKYQARVTGPLRREDEGGDGNGGAKGGEKEEPEKEGEGEVGDGMIKATYLLDVNPHATDVGRGNGANIIDARWIDISNGLFIDITGLMEREPEKRPGVWSCKNHHDYRTTELWPLRRTTFEGVEAMVPYAFDTILTDEYGARSLVTTEWAGHRWVPELKEWVKKKPKKASKKPKPSKETKESKNGNVRVVVEEVVVEGPI